MDSGGFRLSRSKPEYLRCGFSGVKSGGGEINMGGVVIPRVKKFNCLGSIMGRKEILMKILTIILW